MFQIPGIIDGVTFQSTGARYILVVEKGKNEKFYFWQLKNVCDVSGHVCKWNYILIQ